MYDLTELGLQEMALCSRALRKSGEGAESMEEAADRIVRLLYDELGTGGGERACVLVRLYKTHRYGDLPTGLQEFARGVLESEVADGVRCLTLLATVGDQPDWCSRYRSRGHRAIPLPSPETIDRFPMVSRLVRQLGMDVARLVDPEPGLMLDLHQHSFNVFFVPRAEGSPFIPAQDDFVRPYGVASVLGFGGLLPTGELFAVILFSRVPVAKETADLCRPFALAAKLALLPFTGGPVFDPGDVSNRAHG